MKILKYNYTDLSDYCEIEEKNNIVFINKSLMYATLGEISIAYFPSISEYSFVYHLPWKRLRNDSFRNI